MKQIIILILLIPLFIYPQINEDQSSVKGSTKPVCLEVKQAYSGVKNLDLSYTELVNCILTFSNLKVSENNDSKCDINLIIDAKGEIITESKRLIFTDTRREKIVNAYVGVKMFWSLSFEKDNNVYSTSFMENLRFRSSSFDPKADYKANIEPVIKGYREILWTGSFIEDFGTFIATSLNINVVELFTYVSNNNNSEIRQFAIQILEKLDSSQAFIPISNAMSDPDVNIRLQAIKSLIELGDDRMVEPLISALNDNESKVRLQAAKALGNLGNTSAVTPLINLLNDENTFVIITSAKALGKLGDKSGIEPTYLAINKVPKNRRALVAIALGELGDSRAIEYLIPILKGKWMNSEALELLIKLTGEDFGLDYKKWKNWYKQNKSKY